MSDLPDSPDAQSGRRAFVKRLLTSAAVVPPAFAILGATSAEARQVPYEKARQILQRTRRLAVRAKAMDDITERRKALTELQAMERQALSITEKLPKREADRLSTEITELKSNITELKRRTPGGR